MKLTEVLVANAGMISVIMLLLWGISLWRQNVNIIDSFWGLGFVAVAWLSLGVAGQWHLRPVLLTILVTAWGVRLAAYLAWRNHGEPEDHRYAAMREKYASHFAWVSLIVVFGLQGLLMWIVSLPIQVGNSLTHGVPLAMAAGVICWVVGVFFESVGDYQLARFKADPSNEGQVLNQGLWRYTRHPNYFGDFMVWWGFYLIAIEPSTWWWTLISPIVMSILLLRVSGVRLLESSLKSRVDGYQQYVQNTSAFFPMPPSKSGKSHDGEGT